MGTEVRNDTQSTQDAYREKLQDTRDEQDRELSRLKAKHAQEMNREREAGEATISHIRKDNQQHIDSLRDEGENKITYERSAYDRRIQDAQKHKEQELNSLRTNAEDQEQSVKQREEQAFAREREISEREQKTSSAIEQRAEHDRAESLRKYKEDQDNARDLNQKAKNTLTASQNRELQKLNQDHGKVMDATKKEHTQTYERMRMQDEAQIHSEQDKVAHELDHDQTDLAARESGMRERANLVIQKEDEKGQARIRDLKKKNQDTFESERQRGTRSADKAHKYYADEINRIHKEGADAANSQDDINKKQLATQESRYKTETEERQKKFETDRQKAFEVYRNQLAHDDSFYKKSLQQQKAEFDKIYAADANENEQILGDAKEKMTSELVNEKRKITESLGKYSGKQGDPFYRMKTFDFHLNESSDFYELRVRVPETDRDNVKVVVKENKIILQGQRRFEDHIENENHRLATQNYQSFRDEIPLSHPVQEKFAVGHWNGGVYTVKIPKA